MYVGVSQGKQNNVAALENAAFHGLIERSLQVVNTFSLARETSEESCQKYRAAFAALHHKGRSAKMQGVASIHQQAE